MNLPERTQAAISPRSQKAQGKQRQADTVLEPAPQHGVFAMDTDYPFRSSVEVLHDARRIEPPPALGSHAYHAPRPPLPKPYGSPANTTSLQYLPRASSRPITQPQPDNKDPSFFRLPPIRERTISAPMQPRVTDVRVHVEKDNQQQKPAFDVNIRFQFSMEPGQLQ